MNRKHVFILFALPAVSLLVAFFAFCSPAHALQSVPYKMNFQGRVTDAAGTVKANGIYNMKFRIYDTSNAVVWSEDRFVSAGNGVQVTGGLFSIQLGSVNPFDAAIFNTAVANKGSLSLEVELPTPATATTTSPSWTEGAMTPRNPISASAYAMNSDLLDGMDSTGFGQVAGNNTFSGSNTFTNNIRVQSDSPNSFNILNGAGTSSLFKVDPTNGNTYINQVIPGNIGMQPYSSLYFNGYCNGVDDLYLKTGAPAYNIFVASDGLHYDFAASGTQDQVMSNVGTVFGIDAAGSTYVKNDATNAFSVQNTGGSVLFAADTSSSKVIVRGSSVVQSQASATPSIVGSTSGTSAGGTSGSVSTSPNTKTGDLVVVIGYIEPDAQRTASASYGTITVTPSIAIAPGFPINTDDATMTTNYTHRLYVGYFYATADGSSTITMSTTVTSNQIGMLTTTIRGGPTSGNPFADTPATATSSAVAAGITSTPPVSLNLGGTNSLVLWAFGEWDGAGENPAGFTRIAAATPYDGQPTLAYRTYAAAGSTGTITAPKIGSRDGMSAALLSIRGTTTSKVLEADADAGRVQVGNSATDSNAAFFVLDSYNQVSDPSGGISGAMYYNTSSNKFRCYTTAWSDCSGTALAGTLQTDYAGSTGGSTPEIKVDSTRGGINIQDADTTIGGPLFQVTQSNASGLGTAVLSVNSTGAVAIGLAGQTTTMAGNISASGTTLFKPAASGSAAFQIQNNSSIAIFSADTQNTRVQIGSSTTDATAVVMVLDSYNNATDPTGVVGSMYYNTATGKFRCYEGSAWRNCMSGAINVTATVQGAWSTTAAKALSAIVVSPVYVPSTITVNFLTANVTTALGAAGDIGIYDAGGTLVLNGGSSSVSTATGAKRIAPLQTGAARVLQPGQYYAAVTWNSATGVIGGASTGVAGMYGYSGTIASGGGLVLPTTITLSNITNTIYLYGVGLNTY